MYLCVWTNSSPYRLDLVKNVGFVLRKPRGFSFFSNKRSTFCASRDSCFFSGEPGSGVLRMSSYMRPNT